MPKSRDDNPYPEWEGFDTPHYTPVPDDLFDMWLPYLSESELKVLLYIMRRTFGFKKDADAISLRQMTHGIVTRDGRRLDAGAGISERSVIRGVEGLTNKSLIIAEKRSSIENGDEATVYSLRLRGVPTPVRQNVRPPSAKMSDPPSATESDLRPPIWQTQETALQEIAKQDDSNPITPQKKMNGDDPPSSVYIAGIVLDYSRELGDDRNAGANVTQALRLWQESGQSEKVFVELLHEVRKRTRHAQGAQGTGFIANKMAYYFTVLRDLVAAK